MRELKCGHLQGAGIVGLERTRDEIVFCDDGSTFPYGGIVIKVGVDYISDDIRIFELVIRNCTCKRKGNMEIKEILIQQGN